MWYNISKKIHSKIQPQPLLNWARLASSNLYGNLKSISVSYFVFLYHRFSIPLSIMKEQLEHPIFQTIGRLADHNHVEVYVIGGFVRDILMKRDFKNDIDIVVVGSGIS